MDSSYEVAAGLRASGINPPDCGVGGYSDWYRAAYAGTETEAMVAQTVVDPYELSVAETVDDLELFVFWRECRRREGNLWARLLPDDLAVRLFDAGIRSVTALAAAPEHDGRLRQIAVVREFRVELLRAARVWRLLPEAWRQEVAGFYGVRDTPRAVAYASALVYETREE